jgi:caffeoyl-CoA O-methyltransferase
MKIIAPAPIVFAALLWYYRRARSGSDRYARHNASGVEGSVQDRRLKMMKKSGLSILVFFALLAAVGSLTAQRGNRTPQGRWLFDDATPDKRPLPSDPNEEKILNVLDEIAQTDNSNLLVPLADGRLLRTLAESTGAKNVVEIGTYNGYSALWFCLAFRTTGGKLTTHEINPQNAAAARENLKKAGVETLVTIVEGDAHETVTRLNEPIDILFIDADKPGYADYLKKLLPLVRPGGLILAHNTTNTGRQMPDYFTAVTTDPNLDTFFIKEGVGVGVTLKKHQGK